MPPPPVKRCSQCSKSKKKCDMPDDKAGSQCKRCVDRGIPCQGYDWPAVLHPAPGAAQSSNPTHLEDPSSLDFGSRSSLNDVQVAIANPRYQVQSAYGSVAQQNPASIGTSGYSNTEMGFEPTSTTLTPQSTNWPTTQQYIPYQIDPGQGLYLYGQQKQRSGQFGRFTPY